MPHVFTPLYTPLRPASNALQGQVVDSILLRKNNKIGGTFFLPRNKDQNYCSIKGCQKARKAAWQQNKLSHDAEYRGSQRISQKKWRRNNSDYWKQYRQNNPDKTAKNRTLQRIRNKRRTLAPSSPVGARQHLIAKMDVRTGAVLLC
jgi:hypothetical protein